MSEIHDVEYWRAELIAAEDDLRRARLRADAVRRILSGVEDLVSLDPNVDVEADAGREQVVLPTQIIKSTSGVPRGRAALRAILHEYGQEMEQRQIYAVMMAKGWIAPDLKDGFASVRVTLRRMWQAGELDKPRDGVYRLRVAGQTSFDNEEEDTSD